MRAVEREIGLPVIELQSVEADDVGVATQVLAMAGAALTGAGVGHQRMVAAMLAQVGGDVLVTDEAQLVLTPAVTSIVAGTALVLGLGVLGTHLAWLEQRLDRGGTRGFGADAHKRRDHGNRQEPFMSPPFHPRSVELCRDHMHRACNQ